MEPAASPRTFSSLGPALRVLVLALLVSGAQSAYGALRALLAAFGAGAAHPLPGVAEGVAGLVVVAAAAFFLRQADENAQALAGGARVLPPLTLLRLLQPRFEHPLRELWSRSDPTSPGEPMPGSRIFGALWGAGLAIALPLWAFALLAAPEGSLLALADCAHHLALAGACGCGLHLAALLAQRQDEAWSRLKPSVITVPLRAWTRKEMPAPAPAPAGAPAATPAAATAASAPPPAAAATPSAPPPLPVAAAPAAAAARPLAPLREPAAFDLPAACPLCGEKLSSRRCDACGAPALAGPFRTLRLLGGEGARRTLLAEAPDGARVVLKELSFASVPDAQALDAFSREARTLRELRHPRLPTYVDAFREEDGPRARLYLAYRYLEGVSLQEEMHDRRYGEDEVLHLVEEVLELLRHLHGLQPPLIHRDLKPANLVRRRDGSVALIDFGVARDLERALHGGILVGTIGYMPPEQLAGQVDLTCDLYALGATALHLLTCVPPWELMDGPELRLPPLKTAPTARALLRRLLAPRQAQRFSSAREALAALRRLRAGGPRLPRAGLAAAGVAAATALAIGLGAQQRAAAGGETAAVPKPAAAAAKSDRPAASLVRAASAVPAPLAPPPLATWRGGALGRSEVEEGLRRLPPWLKSDQPWWIQQHVLALVRRKLLVAEAERRGLAPPLGAAGPERERLLVRALLEAEVRKQGDLQPGAALRKAWDQTSDALFSAAGVRLEPGQIFQLEPQKLAGAPPAAGAEPGSPGRLEFLARSGPCVLEVEPALHRYGGRCEGVDSLSQALLEPDTLQLVDLAPGSVLPAGFYARYTDDFVDGRGRDLAAAQEAEAALVRADLRLSEATGTLSPSGALDLLGAVAPALRRCLATAMQNAPERPQRATARIQVELRAGAPAVARLESTPRLVAGACARALARPELGGSGTMTVVADLERR